MDGDDDHEEVQKGVEYIHSILLNSLLFSSSLPTHKHFHLLNRCSTSLHFQVAPPQHFVTIPAPNILKCLLNEGNTLAGTARQTVSLHFIIIWTALHYCVMIIAGYNMPISIKLDSTAANDDNVLRLNQYS